MRDNLRLSNDWGFVGASAMHGMALALAVSWRRWRCGSRAAVLEKLAASNSHTNNSYGNSGTPAIDRRLTCFAGPRYDG